SLDPWAGGKRETDTSIATSDGNCGPLPQTKPEQIGTSPVCTTLSTQESRNYAHKPGVGYRHHLHTYGSWVHVSHCHYRPAQSVCGRLGLAQYAGGRELLGSPEKGNYVLWYLILPEIQTTG